MTRDPAVGWSVALLRGPGRAAALALVAGALALRVIDPGVITELRVRGFDLVEKVWPRVNDSARVAIVDIDEKSLAQYGQWPWPRHLVAELVRRIAKGKPRVIGIEILFAERDRLSPNEIARELPDLPPALSEALAQLPPSDRELDEAIATVPTVLSLAPSHEETTRNSGPLRLAPLRQAGDDPTPFLKSYKSIVQSQPELRAAALAAGEIAVEPDADGVIRRLALAVAYQQTIVPSFALEVVRVGGGEQAIVIDTGFVENTMQDRVVEDRAVAKLVTGEPVTLTGYLRFPESPGLFTPSPSRDKRLWFARDHLAMRIRLPRR